MTERQIRGRRMLSRQAIAWAVLMLVSPTLAFWFGRHSAPAIDRVELSTHRESGREPIASVRELSPDLTPPPAASQPFSERTDLAAAIKPWAALIEGQRRGIASFEGPVADRNGRLSNPFIKLFELTSTEVTTLETAIVQGQREMEKLTVERAVVTRADSDALVITIGVIPEGPEVYDQIMDTFSATLGNDRYEALLQLELDKMPGLFGKFGAEIRTISISRSSRSVGREAGFELKDQREWRDPFRDVAGSVSTIGDSMMDPLLSHFQWLVPLIPPGWSLDVPE